MLKKLNYYNNRLLAHFAMLIGSLWGWYLASLYGPNNTTSENLSIGLGYVSLILIAVTLLIGPVNLLRKRKNPVNINLRRDIGIWSGITACLHVGFSLQIYTGKSVLEYFIGKGENSIFPTFGLFELSNDVGLAATLIIVVLLVTSNQLSLKQLKGKRWKFLQRFNYLLLGLVLIHTFAFQSLNARESYFSNGVLFLSLVVIMVQLCGVAITKSRAEVRKASTSLPVTPYAANRPPLLAQPGQLNMVRRRFLTVTGGILLGGVTLTGAAAYLLKRSQTPGNSTELAIAPPNNPQSTNSVINSEADVNSEAGSNSGNSQAGTSPTEETPPSVGTAQGNSQTGPVKPINSSSEPTLSLSPNSGTQAQLTKTNPVSPNPTTPAASNGKIIGNFANLPAGSATKFTTPDSGEAAFVIHEKDGSVKAYSGICTHRPYTLVFNQSQQALVCNLHGVPFNVISGIPASGPAYTPLQSYKVHIDSQNNIVYDLT